MTEEVKPFRWSFSQWESYQQCPRKWHYQSVMKLPRGPTGPAAFRGLEMHKSVEEFIEGADAHVLHKDIHPKYIPIFEEFRDHPNGDRGTEKRLSFDEDWNLAGTLTSKKATVVAVLDAYRYSKPTFNDLGVLKIAEWKSGKPKDTHVDQRKLYAPMGFKAWMADRVEVTTYYLEDTAPPQRVTLASPESYEKLKSVWLERASEMERNKICAPRPGFYCRWCDFSQSKGGPCQFS